MELTVSASREPAVGELGLEVVERKGRGHPDTICDRLAEEFSISLSRFYLERFGAVLHHNVDKALLRAGSARPAFGGGQIDAPMEIYLAGRATNEFRGAGVPVGELAAEGSRSWLRRNLHALDPDRDVRVHCLARPGSQDLVELFLRSQKERRWLANDTSIGVGFAPMTDLERVVESVEMRLNDAALKAACPEVGEDVKVMGIRRGGRIDLTVSCAFVGRAVTSLEDYLEKKERARRAALEAAAGETGMEVSIEINRADDPARGSIYLTVTGTSAEAGDDGQAGRGNRANGLITPFRPMTLEAAAGKNPMSHVGKLYQIASRRIAEAAVARIPAVAAAECTLVSQIGRPLRDPRVAGVGVTLRKGARPPDVAPAVGRIVEEELEGLDGLWREILEGRLAVS
jgi:S-adenosylmethionine synthetase